MVSITKLLEGLEDWSDHQVSDMQISDMYVRFGNDFNAAVITFDSFAIDMGCVKSPVLPSLAELTITDL